MVIEHPPGSGLPPLNVTSHLKAYFSNNHTEKSHNLTDTNDIHILTKQWVSADCNFSYVILYGMLCMQYIVIL